jgi:4-alpha-glucanotransferase
MKKDSYAWWCSRVEHMLTLFDGVRIDHFRAFESYWSVPSNAKSAKEGKWVKGPGRSLIDKIRETAGDRLIIAEDLGDITEQVQALLKYSKFPGMRVFQFAFLGDRESVHLPHNYPKNCIAYTGTHDNATLLSYTWEVTPENRREIFSYCGYDGDNKETGCQAIMRTMLASPADTVIFPIQDILIYGSDTRMNTPGVAEGNWQYRLTKDQLDSIDRNKFKTWNRDYFRI